jgi:hypothetical protein
MKNISRMAAALFVLALAAGLAVAQQAGKKIVNRKCPLKTDSRVDPQQTVVYNGKIVGFCCSDCVDKWKKNPASYAAAVKEDAHLPVEPEGYTDVKSALEAGKGGGYLVVALYIPKGGKSPLLTAISDPSIEGDISNCAFAKVEFDANSADAKALKVTAANTLVFVDPRPEPVKIIKTLTSGAAAVVLKELQAARKEMEK